MLHLKIKPWKDADRSEPDSFHGVTWALVVLEHDDEVMSLLWNPTRVKAGLLSTRYPIGSFALANALDR